MTIAGNQDEVHNLQINKGMRAIADMQAKASGDPHRLNYHFMSPAAWINDPNGLIYYQGEYHLFYQVHPFSAENGLKHWGHAKSKDLIHWEHLPIALAPTEKFEEHGCFSGTAVENSGNLTVVYTGNVLLNKKKTQVQCVAVSEDGITFKKYDKNPVIAEVPPEGSADFRDPKVWKHDHIWYMAIGSGKDGKGNVLLYQSDDLLNWDYIGKMFESQTAEEGIVWNCPDFFSIGGKDVLIVSPAVFEGNIDSVRKCIYYIGKMDYQTGKFTAEKDGDIDLGFDFYAPQTLVDDRNRIILFGWMDMWFNPMPSKAYGWAGAMTIPREVFLLPEGKLGFRPVKELEDLRNKHQSHLSFTLTPENNVFSIMDGDSLEIIVEFDLTACLAKSFGIKLRQSEESDQDTVISYYPKSHELTVKRPSSTEPSENTSRFKIDPTPNNTLQLHIFLDRSSIELFANHGSTAITKRIYPDPSALGMEIFSIDGSVKVKSLDVWELESIW
jgi:beta-fructofuranosidase